MKEIKANQNFTLDGEMILKDDTIDVKKVGFEKLRRMNNSGVLTPLLSEIDIIRLERETKSNKYNKEEL